MSVMDEVDRLTRLAGENRMEMLLFALTSPQVYGINVFKIREILPCPPLRRVPHSHPFVRGVMRTRGQTVTVIDLGAVLGQYEDPRCPHGTVIITEYSGRVLGYLVRTVHRIVNLDWERVRPPPAGLGDQTCMTAVAAIDDQLVEIIDVERILADIVGLSSTVTADVRLDGAGLPRHVFIADDSAVARRQIGHVMTQIGVTFDCAENGRDALARLHEYAAQGPVGQRLAMLISDIEMPVMDGYTVTRRLKATPALQDLHVCLHTSLSGGFNQAMAASVGADRLLPKFDLDELAREVARVLAGAGSPLPPAA